MSSLRLHACSQVLGWALATLLAVPCALAVPSTSLARHQLDQAVALAKKGHLDQAFLLASQAAQGQSQNSEFVTVRELLRQRATLAHLERAHGLLLAHEPAQAAVEFRTALAIDPSSLDARQGLSSAFPRVIPLPPASTELRVLNAASPVQLQPTAGVRAFHLRTALRPAIAQIAAAYGLRAYVADPVPNRTVRLDIADASFAQAMAALHDVGSVDWIPLDAHTLYFAEASEIRQVQPLALRTFYLPWVSDGIALNEISNVLKSLLGIRSATIDVDARALSLRATPAQLDAAEQLLLDLRNSPGEVMLQVKILEVSATTARDLGLSQPDQFTMFALGPLLAQLQQSNSLQQDILQLFEEGGLNAVLNSGQLSSSQLAQAQSVLSPLLQNPFVVFGGGATLMALSVPNFSASVSATNGRVSSIETALLRATSGESAELKIGQRYPIINASFSPISLSPAISQVIGNGSFIQPFPSFTYEDLGLDAKMTPFLSPSGELRLQVEITVKGLTGVSTNNIPILSNRHVVSELGLKDGEPVMLAGLLDREEMTTLAGLPGLSQIPGLGRLFSTQTGQNTNDQLVLVITPHVVKLSQQQSAALWLPAGFAAMSNVPAAPPSFRTPPLLAPGERPTAPNGGRGSAAGPGGLGHPQ